MVRKTVLHIRKFFWSLLIAFMVGMHNFYHQEYHSPDDLKSKIENIQEVNNDSDR